MPQLPGGPDPTQPVPRDPVLGFDLDAYAAVAADLAREPRRRAELLALRGLDELSWAKVEQTWLLRVATAALHGDVDLTLALDAATERAKQAQTSATRAG